MPLETNSKGINRRELALVSFIVIAVSTTLFWRLLPLPHQDLNFYTEPAYLLATTGHLAGPGSQAVDITYQKGIYSYPPGYFLIVAGWLKLFGLSNNSLLAYIHLVHACALIMLWIILRERYLCPAIVTVLVLLAVFPRMAHGRPDLTAATLSIAAWLALPEELAWGRLILSGCLAGGTLLVSPGFGVGIISTLLILLILDTRQTFRRRCLSTLVWLTAAGIIFCGLAATVLTWQHSWTIAYFQFKTNIIVRGAELNVWPDFRLLYVWAFCVVPFLLMALLPALLVAGGFWKGIFRQFRPLALAFLGSAGFWLALNKSQLLLDHHFLFPAKSVFVAVFYSSLKLPKWIRLAPLALLCVISFYLYKSDFLYLGSPLRVEERANSAGVQPRGIVGVDSLYFPRFYRPGQTLNFEVSAFENYWPRYRAALPAFARASLLAGLPDKPMDANMYLVSAYTVSRLKEPAFALPCKPSDTFAERLHILGRTWNLPAHPYALMVCRRDAP